MCQSRKTIGQNCVHLIIILFLAFLSTLATAIENNPLSNGFYATPSCEKPESQVYLVNGSFFLFLEERVGFWSSEETIKKEKLLLERFPFLDNEKYLAYRWSENGNYFFAGRNFKFDIPELTSLPSDPPDGWQVLTYLPCKGLNSTSAFIHAEGATFLEFMSEIDISQCGSNSNNCLVKLWRYVDVSGDSKLSKAEISRLIRILTYVGTVQSADVFIPNDELLSQVGLVSMIAPFIASSIIDGSDYDNDKQLGLDELFLDRDTGIANQALEKMSFDVVVSTLGGLFKGLPLLGSLVK